MAKVKKRVPRTATRKKGNRTGRENVRELSAETVAKLERIAAASKKT